MLNKLRTKINTGVIFALGLIILLMLGGLTYRDMTDAADAAREVDHTYVVLRRIDDVFSSVKDAEAAQRGFVITGEKKYLEPYYKATEDIKRTFSILKDLTRDNPRQQRTLDRIGSAIGKKLAYIKETIDIARTKGHRAAMKVVETGIGEKLMDDIRGKVAEARDQETRLLKARAAARRTAAVRLTAAIAGGGGLSLALLLTAFFFLRSEIARRIEVEGELRRHQEGLEELVEERTRDLAVANGRLKEENAMRKRAEEELRKSLEELARSNKELDQFASIASHDLRAPLRMVSGFVNLLAARYKGKLDQKADEYIAYAVNGANRMSVLIHDLYVYARVGTQGKQFTTVDLNALASEAIDNLKEVIDENKAVITRDELPRAEGDDTQLVQLFQNLIGNAIKFRKKEAAPRIHISAEHKEFEWIVGVHDNGIGIEPRFYEQIFVIFQRLHTSEEYPGTGLGLAVCKKIVDRHEGRIWIESKPGRGSSFYFTMPARTGKNLSKL